MTDPSQVGHYRILDELGRGIIGVLYHGRDEVGGRDVTIKMLPPDQALVPELRLRLEREAKALRSRTRSPTSI